MVRTTYLRPASVHSRFRGPQRNEAKTDRLRLHEPPRPSIALVPRDAGTIHGSEIRLTCLRDGTEPFPWTRSSIP